jgi:hypothetical protein
MQYERTRIGVGEIQGEVSLLYNSHGEGARTEVLWTWTSLVRWLLKLTIIRLAIQYVVKLLLLLLLFLFQEASQGGNHCHLLHLPCF